MTIQNIPDLSSEEVQDLEDKCKSKLSLLGKNFRVIKEEVFEILANCSCFIQYPIEDDELCGFVCRKKGIVFSFVNSYIPFEKQIFAAAHELYHIWFDEDVLNKGELLKIQVLDPQETDQLNSRETKANRFAAIFLVPKDVLVIELDNLRVKNNKDLELSHIIKLMDVFGVPYKTIVRRLYEINFVSYEKCLDLLKIPDRDEMSGVRLLQKRLQVGNEWQKRTKNVKFHKLVHNALLAYEQDKITPDKLKYLLSVARTTPEEFNIFLSKTPTEKELLQLLENEDE